MEQKVRENLAKLKTTFDGRDIICLVYSQDNPEGIKLADVQFMNVLLKQTKINNPLLLLHGHGGDMIPSVMMPHLLHKKVSNYKVYIPIICCSGLCYTIFKAQEVIVTKDTVITQIDPIFVHNGETLRAIKHLHSPDSEIKDMARDVFDVAQTNVKELTTPPSIFKFKTMEPGEFAHHESLVGYFMNKKDHEAKISMKELKEIEVNIIDDENPERKEFAEELIEACQNIMKPHGTRVIFVSSVPFKIDGEDNEGIYMCPLK
jgi:hypothetical protein